MRFQNRVSDYANRKKIKIVSQTPTELIADIERADTNVTIEGTPLNAEVFNEWDEAVTSAVSRIGNAETLSMQAKQMVQSAADTAGSAYFSVNNVRSPVTGVVGTMQQTIDDIFCNVTVGITAENNDALNLTAAAYDGKNITAFTFDTISGIIFN